MMKKNSVTKVRFAVAALLLLLASCRADEAHPHPDRIRSLDTACSTEIHRYCPVAGLGDTLSCLLAVPPSRVRNTCSAWVAAYDSCLAGLQRRQTPCNLNTYSLQHCLRHVDSHDLSEACTSHDIFHIAKALSTASHRKKRQF
jgi:hypothetical protein